MPTGAFEAMRHAGGRRGNGRTHGLCAVFWRLVGLAWLALTPPAALAECPSEPARWPADLAAHARHLQALAPACRHDPDFLAWQGAVLLELGQLDAAVAALERALLIAPAHAAARAHYARALALAGEWTAARELARELAASEVMPLARSPWRASLGLGARLMHDSNLNLAPGLSALELSLPGGSVWLPLAPDSRPRAGLIWHVDASARFARERPDGGAQRIDAQWIGRLALGEAVPDRAQFDLQALFLRPISEHERVWGLGGGSQLWGGAEIARHARLLWRQSVSPARAGCRSWAGQDLEWHHYPGRVELDYALIQWLALRACPGEHAHLLQLGLGREFALDGRPGGDTWRLDARHHAGYSLGLGRLESELRLALRADDEGYSPLLERGRRLYRRQLSARIEYRQPLGQGWEGLINAEAERQWASLPLFEWRRAAFGLGLRRQW